MRVLALVPARNEAESLPTVVDALRQEDLGLDVLIVDDASTDSTSDIAEALGLLRIRLCEHLGVGAAIRAGLRYAALLGYSIVVRIDGDGQHPASEIHRVLEPILSGRADAVVGSRYTHASSFPTSTPRRLAQRVAAAWVSATARQRVTDVTSGFWAFGPRAVRLLAVHHPTGYPEPELVMLLCRSGLRVEEVPTEMTTRLAGTTSLTPGRLGLACVITALSLMIAPLRETPGEVGG